MFGPQNCREWLDQFGMKFTKELLEVLKRDNDEEIQKFLPSDLKQYHKAEIYRHARNKIEENDDATYMY